MDTPFLLLALLALPVVAAGLIVTVARIRRRAPVAAVSEPVHRLQADSATVQDAADHTPAAAPARRSGRARRAAEGTLEDR